jgi:hypothetical protein
MTWAGITHNSDTMKTPFLLWLSFLLATSLFSQAPTPAEPEKHTPEYLDQLLAPIALYPDPLIALILPGSTMPTDIVLAARFAREHAELSKIDDQPWDDSVKALARYPDVILWMDENLEWTTDLGEAYTDHAPNVLEAIQRLRAKAKANGNLVDTDEQKIDVEDADIIILPANPEAIYIPSYDPEVVYVQPPVVGGPPLVVFGPRLGVGPWLHLGLVWPRRGIYLGDWRPGWGPVVNPRPWKPLPGRPRVVKPRPPGPRPPGLKPPRPKPPGGLKPHPPGGGKKPPPGGGKKPPPGGGKKPPPGGGGKKPPHDGGGKKPPHDGGRKKPPHDGGGKKPPHDGGGKKPPHGGGGKHPPSALKGMGNPKAKAEGKRGAESRDHKH